MLGMGTFTVHFIPGTPNLSLTFDPHPLTPSARPLLLLPALLLPALLLPALLLKGTLDTTTAHYPAVGRGHHNHWQYYSLLTDVLPPLSMCSQERGGRGLNCIQKSY